MKPLIIILFCVATTVYSQDMHYFFVFLNKKADRKELPKEELDKIMDGHMANIERLAKEGKLIVAGPFEGGGGIFIFKASSLEETRSWLSTDPGVQANRWNVEVLSYTPRMGSVCAAPEPIQMVTYDFIRFIPNESNAQKKGRAADSVHLAYLKENDHVVTEGSFGSDGAILILKGELQKSVVEADPWISSGSCLADYKKLYVAKGAFCEK